MEPLGSGARGGLGARRMRLRGSTMQRTELHSLSHTQGHFWPKIIRTKLKVDFIEHTHDLMNIERSKISKNNHKHLKPFWEKTRQAGFAKQLPSDVIFALLKVI